MGKVGEVRAQRVRRKVRMKKDCSLNVWENPGPGLAAPSSGCKTVFSSVWPWQPWVGKTADRQTDRQSMDCLCLAFLSHLHPYEPSVSPPENRELAVTWFV